MGDFSFRTNIRDIYKTEFSHFWRKDKYDYTFFVCPNSTSSLLLFFRSVQRECPGLLASSSLDTVTLSLPVLDCLFLGVALPAGRGSGEGQCPPILLFPQPEGPGMLASSSLDTVTLFRLSLPVLDCLFLGVALPPAGRGSILLFPQPEGPGLLASSLCRLWLPVLECLFLSVALPAAGRGSGEGQCPPILLVPQPEGPGMLASSSLDTVTLFRLWLPVLDCLFLGVGSGEGQCPPILLFPLPLAKSCQTFTNTVFFYFLE